MSDQTKAALESKRVQTLNEKCDFFSFSNFTGHVMDWGVKMIITKVITPVQLLSYISILVNISEEYGGTKTAYYYDLLARQHMAKTLHSGSTEVKDLFLKVDNEIVGKAQLKVKQRLEEQGRDKARATNTAKGDKGGGKDKHTGGKGNGNYKWGEASATRRERSRSRGRGNQYDSRKEGKNAGGKGGSKDNRLRR